MNRALLLAALLLAAASSALAQTATPLPAVTPSRPEIFDNTDDDSGAADLGPSSDTHLVWVETTVGTQVVLEEDTQRTYSSVTNTQTNGEVLCVNASLPQTSLAIGRLRYGETISWGGQAARYAVHCFSPSGVTVKTYEYRAEVINDPDSADDDGVYAVDPTPEPEPTSTPAIQFGGSSFHPSNPGTAPSSTPTPTPTPYLYVNDDSYPGTLIDQATPTPSPTPVEIVVD